MDISKVLLVDDDDDVRRLGQISLEMVGGWTVLLACSGPEALDQALNEPPDLVLLDVTMPGMDGPTTFSNLREIPSMETTPIIFLTAKTASNEVDALLALGAAGVISKPFDPMGLPDEIRRVLA